jgi:hypothetical protein
MKITSDDVNEDEREIIRVKASTYINYPSKKHNELTVDTEIGKLADQTANDSVQFQLHHEGTENEEFTQRRLEAEALEALKEKEREDRKVTKKRISNPSRTNEF